MYEKPSFEIPDQVRQLAEKNVEQTRSAYNQFLDMARKAQDMAAKSQGDMVQAAMDVQTRALKYADDNMQASFRLASELARARDLQQYVEIQSRHAQEQMKAFSDQASELGKLMSDVAQRSTKS